MHGEIHDLHMLGSTGIAVSRLGFGLAAVGRPAYITSGRGGDLGNDRSVAAMERRCHELLDAACALGIRYVDAARSYGFAEKFLASWLNARRIPEGDIAIGSKWGYAYVGGWQLDAPVHEIKDLSAGALRKQWAESRGLLGRHLRLYQIHSATVESGVLDDPEVLGELARLRGEGIAIGLTTTGPAQGETIRRALAATAGGVNPFQCVQATWNLLETSAAEALAEAHDRGWGVIVKEALANGRLAARADIALAAALSQPWADVVLTGAATADQLRSNVRALALVDPARAWPAIAESPETYWNRRRALAWT